MLCVCVCVSERERERALDSREEDGKRLRPLESHQSLHCQTERRRGMEEGLGGSTKTVNRKKKKKKEQEWEECR